MLQHYKFIWQQPAAAARKAPRQVVIINLQPTPKDKARSRPVTAFAAQKPPSP